MQLNDAVFVVTGGASGLGESVARMLVDAGARAVVADANAEAVTHAATWLGSNGSAVHADVTSEHDALRVVRTALDAFGRLDGLVNCAGISPAEFIAGKAGPHRLDTFRRVMDVNVNGSFNMIRLVVDAMLGADAAPTEERGVIVNTASITAFDGQVGQVAYAGSKAAVAGMTLPVARELARFGIRVMTIAPGIFETPMLRTGAPALRDALSKEVPFPARPGKPEEFAALVRHVIENPYLNGEVIRLDGAARLPFRMQRSG